MLSKRFSIVAGALALLALRAGNAYDGEYGLRVEDRRDTLVVHWITSEPAKGTLEVTAGTQKQTFHTPVGQVHSVALRRPRGSAAVLRYGSAANQYATTLNLQTARRAPVLPAADSIFIMGDTHGEFDKTVQLLRVAGLLDADGKWAGRTNQLVFNGDLTDRGPDVNRLLWFIYGLEQQAQRAGGRVHVVLGNHESMVFTGDLRYVHAKELALAQTHGVSYAKLYDIRESVLGRWLASKPGVLRIGDVLFAHGGISGDWLGYTPKMFDDSLTKFMGEELFYRWADTTATFKIDSAGYARRSEFFFGPNSVFWYRGYVQSDSLSSQLDKVLEKFDATVHVVAHTPTQMVHQKYGGKLVIAHPRTPAIEMVLLARQPKGYQRLRIVASGERSTLPQAAVR